MGIFSEMESLGLGKFKNTKIMEEKEEKEEMRKYQEQKSNATKVQLTEADCLFDKQYECPICDNKFNVKSVKSTKLRVLAKETDLRTIYEAIDPVKYEVITCGLCGYSALLRYYGKISYSQIKRIKEEVKYNFVGIDTNKEILTYDDAITRYKLALICSKVKFSKWSEKAYTFLKLAWVYRGKRQEITSKEISEDFTKEDKIKMIKELYDNECECMEQAYEGFNLAYSSESMPICGMDDSTFTYLVGDLARRVKRYDESLRYLERVIMSKATIQRIKDEAVKVRDMVKEEIKRRETERQT